MNKEIPQNIKKETENLKKQPPRLKERLDNFLKLKIGIAYLYNALVNELRNNTLNLEKANEIIAEFKEKFKFPNDLVKKISNLVKSILNKKEKIEEIRKSYPDNKQLFMALLGKEPKGEIEIITRPLAIYIKCLNPEDFYAFNEDIQKINPNINKVIAVNLPTCLIKELSGLIIIENSSALKTSNYTTEDILKHEEQHVIDRLLLGKKKLEITYKKLPNDLNKIEETDDLEKRKELMERIIKKLARNFINKYMGSELKSEIFAHLKMGKSIEYTFSKLSSSIEPNKNYYFLNCYKNEFIYKLQQILNNPTEIVEMAEKIFQEEYQIIMDGARKSLKLLNQELEFSNDNLDTIIGLLNYEDLTRWPAITRIIISALNSSPPSPAK